MEFIILDGRGYKPSLLQRQARTAHDVGKGNAVDNEIHEAVAAEQAGARVAHFTQGGTLPKVQQER